MSIRSINILALACLSLAGPRSPAQEEEAQKGKDVRLENVCLGAALDSLMRWYGVSIVYLDRDVEGQRVTTSCRGCGFEQALGLALQQCELSWVRVGTQVILRKTGRAVPEEPLFTLCGTVTDSASGEWIASALVTASDSTGGGSRHWCTTNSCGFYSLRGLRAGDYQIGVRALGYNRVRMPVSVGDGDLLSGDLRLQAEEIMMQEVTVEGIRMAVTSAEGYARGIYVHTTPSDQNQYLLDGTRIYNPAHFAGVLSSFNDEALTDVQSAPGGIPASYGGRIGSILDLTMRDGTLERLRGAAGTGSLGSHLALEGPFGERTSFLVTARRAYPLAQVPFLEEHGPLGRLGSFEATGKVGYRLSGSSRLSLSAYTGSDSYDNEVTGSSGRLSNDFAWGNSAATLRLVGIVSPSIFVQTSLSYAHYGFHLHHLLENPPPELSDQATRSEYSLDDVTFRVHAEHYYDQDHTLQGGMELIHHQMRGHISTFSSRIGPLVFDPNPAWEFAVYLEDQWRLSPLFTAGLGARASTFSGAAGSVSAVDPRFSLRLALTERTRLYGALGAVSQFLHPYRNSGVFLFYPSIFWYPSGASVRPSTAFQATVGFEQSTADDRYDVSIEPYYQVIQNLHEFRSDMPWSGAASLEDALVYGTGKSYGIGFTLRKRTGMLTGSVHYTLSWGKDRFSELNGGAPFDARFDRRHELQAELEYHPSASWTLGALCALASDRTPTALPVQQPPGQVVADQGGTTRQALQGGGGDFPDLNGARVPGFQRLELKALYSLTLWAYPCQIAVRLINGYGLLDPFQWKLVASSDPRYQWGAGVRSVALFPLYPTLGFSVRL